MACPVHVAHCGWMTCGTLLADALLSVEHGKLRAWHLQLFRREAPVVVASAAAAVVGPVVVVAFIPVFCYVQPTMVLLCIHHFFRRTMGSRSLTLSAAPTRTK